MNLKNKLLYTVCLTITIGSVAYNIFYSKNQLLKCMNPCMEDVNTIEQFDIESCQVEYIKMLSEIQNSYYVNKSIVLKNIEYKIPLLIYRYSENMCNTCIMEDLEELKMFKKELGSNHLCVLPAYKESRNNNVILSNDLKGFNYVNIPTDTLKIPIHSSFTMRRYFGIINRQGELGMIYFPVRGHQNETRYYFSIVKDIINEMLP